MSKKELKLDTVNASRVIALISEGLICLDSVVFQEGTIPSKTWEGRIFLRNMLADQPNKKELNWLWDTIRSFPNISTENLKIPDYGVTYYPDHKEHHVFDEGQTFFISFKRLKPNIIRSYENNDHTKDPIITLKQPLKMRRGKAGRLECCNVAAEVKIHLDKNILNENIIKDVNRQAGIAGLAPDLVSHMNNFSTFTVTSLNQAYTVASRMLEPERKSHGGRCYDHLVCVLNDSYKGLEEVRREVESGSWPPQEENKK